MKKDLKKSYERAIKIIVQINEQIVDGIFDEDDPLLDEIAQIRKVLDEDSSEVIGRLLYSFQAGGKIIEIDEATPGSHAHWG